ncbi:uncharacterized protein A4U43_C04F22810 [Asparagus officinalis]|uniref:BolA-like protein n=1 Tax=Asparagus officinalis TaxID=4686 RepID=A0A5P1F4T7_ASPOF|nr:protein BOLA4, chloroplastic/mitochondrial [Asparagus officinalis]ONK72753.1 uncharacterized protein A4U43_C04F22810 [Asparagus officinalis]
MMMTRLRSQALLMGSSSYPLASALRRVSSLPQRSTITPPLVSRRSLRVASSPSRSKLEPRGASTGGPRSRFCAVRASHQASDAGPIDSNMMQSMETKIKEQLNAETVIVKDAYGDGRHVSIYVVSTAFEGQSAVNRQRMVYKAIWEELQSTVHAVDQMVTSTPAEANKTSTPAEANENQ